MYNADSLVKTIQDLLPNLLKQFDWGLNIISIILVWLGLLPPFENIALAGLGFLCLSYVISSFTGGLEWKVLVTDIVLTIVAGYIGITSDNILYRLAVPLITTYICLKRIGLIHEANQLFGLVLLFVILLFAGWCMFSRPFR